MLQSNDLDISTWLVLGATIQCLLVVSLPRKISLLPPIAFLAYRIGRSFLIATGWLSNPYSKGVTHGRQTWMIPNADGTPATTPSRDTIVVMVLGASWSSPTGMFSPGTPIMGDYFMNMWKDAKENREKYGFLGVTPNMSPEASGPNKGVRDRTIVSLSYWKSLDGLHKFASSKAHMKGQVWWNSGSKDKYPHIGLMHEIYEAPKGSWEAMYHNCKPFGLGKCRSEFNPKSEPWTNRMQQAPNIQSQAQKSIITLTPKSQLSG